MAALQWNISKRPPVVVAGNRTLATSEEPKTTPHAHKAFWRNKCQPEILDADVRWESETETKTYDALFEWNEAVFFHFGFFSFFFKDAPPLHVTSTFQALSSGLKISTFCTRNAFPSSRVFDFGWGTSAQKPPSAAQTCLRYMKNKPSAQIRPLRGCTKWNVEMNTRLRRTNANSEYTSPHYICCVDPTRRRISRELIKTGAAHPHGSFHQFKWRSGGHNG